MNQTTNIRVLQRRDRLMQEHVHDTYKIRSKPLEPTVCTQCRAVYHRGRWQWADSWPYKSHYDLCPACHRTKDRDAAGILTLTGTFVQNHKDEILHLARHLEAQETQDHPLHRIMSIQELSSAIVIRTTDLHLPHRIGHALHDSFAGELHYHYKQESCFVHVEWRREK